MESNKDILTGNYEIIAKRNDFIYSNDNEPHSQRRKELITKYGPSLNKLFGHEPLTKYIVFGLVSTQLYLSYLLSDDMFSLKFCLITYFVGATITQSLFLAIHEISHNLAFKNATHNKLLGMFTNIPILFPMFITFKGYHQEHHKYQGDVELDTDIPTYYEAKLLSSKAGKIFFLLNQTWFYAIRPIFMKQQELTRWHALNLFIQLIADYMILYYLGFGAIIYLLACIHLAGSIHPCASHFIAEHYVFIKDIETHSYYGWLNNLCFNVGYHNEHHDFPNVPWSRLPKLHSLAKTEYNILPYHDSWTKVLWTFINNSNVTLFNRIKRNTNI